MPEPQTGPGLGVCVVLGCIVAGVLANVLHPLLAAALGIAAMLPTAAWIDRRWPRG